MDTTNQLLDDRDVMIVMIEEIHRNISPVSMAKLIINHREELRSGTNVAALLAELHEVEEFIGAIETIFLYGYLVGRKST